MPHVKTTGKNDTKQSHADNRKKKLIRGQTFQPGKSCTSQVLHPTQHIEDWFETKKIAESVFLDLSAAYNTINLKKLKRLLILDIKFNKIIEMLLIKDVSLSE